MVDSVFQQIFTVRNVVAERLCFHRRLSFCSQGGCIPACTGADTPPGQTPLWADRHPQADTPGQKPPWADTPGQTRPQADTSSNGHCSGWYASYWNAFLFSQNFRKICITLHILSCCEFHIATTLTIHFENSQYYIVILYMTEKLKSKHSASVIS